MHDMNVRCNHNHTPNMPPRSAFSPTGPRPRAPYIPYSNFSYNFYSFERPEYMGPMDFRPPVNPRDDRFIGLGHGAFPPPPPMRHPGPRQRLYHADYYADTKGFESADEYAQYQEALAKEMETIDESQMTTFQKIKHKAKHFAEVIKEKFVAICRKIAL